MAAYCTSHSTIGCWLGILALIRSSRDSLRVRAISSICWTARSAAPLLWDSPGLDVSGTAAVAVGVCVCVWNWGGMLFVVVFKVAVVFCWILFGFDRGKASSFKEQRSDCRLPVGIVSEMGEPNIAKELCKSGDDAMRRALHITYSGIMTTPGSDVHRQHGDEVVFCRPEKCIVGNNVRDCTRLGPTASMLRVRTAPHYTKWTPRVIGQMSEPVSLKFCWSHKLRKGKWYDTRVLLLHRLLAHDHTVEISVLLANFIINLLCFEAAASSLSWLFGLKAKCRAYGKK